MVNPREAYWRWLILGLRGLVVMIEEQANDQKLGPELSEKLAEYTGRLQAVTERMKCRNTAN